MAQPNSEEANWGSWDYHAGIGEPFDNQGFWEYMEYAMSETEDAQASDPTVQNPILPQTPSFDFGLCPVAEQQFDGNNFACSGTVSGECGVLTLTQQYAPTGESDTVLHPYIVLALGNGVRRLKKELNDLFGEVQPMKTPNNNFFACPYAMVEPFSCSHKCFNTFEERCQLKKHMKEQHGIVVPPLAKGGDLDEWWRSVLCSGFPNETRFFNRHLNRQYARWMKLFKRRTDISHHQERCDEIYAQLPPEAQSLYSSETLFQEAIYQALPKALEEYAVPGLNLRARTLRLMRPISDLVWLDAEFQDLLRSVDIHSEQAIDPALVWQ